MKNRLNRLLAMIYKEFIYLIRDKKMRIIIVVVPIIQAVLLGYAVNMDLKEIKTAVIDMDNTAESRYFADTFFAGEVFKRINVSDMQEAEKTALSGKALIIISIPRGFAERLVHNEKASVQVIIDAVNSVNAGMASGYVGNVVKTFNEKYISEKSGFSGSIGINTEIRTWFNKDFESRNFFVPSMLAMLMLIVTVMLSGMAIVQEKESGTMEQLTVSPITAWEFIIGKSVPFAIVSFFDVILIIVISVFWFDIHITGSLTLLLFSSVLYIMCTLGVGLVVSAISSTQQQASMSMFMIIFPLILLSGFAFPIDNMPEVIRWVTYLNPMRYYLIIIVGVFMKGLDINSLMNETLALFGLSIVYISVAATFLRRKLD